jgi:hypothetical protein
VADQVTLGGTSGSPLRLSLIVRSNRDTIRGGDSGSRSCSICPCSC